MHVESWTCLIVLHLNVLTNFCWN